MIKVCAPIALMRNCKIYCNLSQLSSFFTTKVYRTVCVLSKATIWYDIVAIQKYPLCKQDLKSTKVLLSFIQLDKKW